MDRDHERYFQFPAEQRSGVAAGQSGMSVNHIAPDARHADAGSPAAGWRKEKLPHWIDPSRREARKNAPIVPEPRSSLAARPASIEGLHRPNRVRHSQLRQPRQRFRHKAALGIVSLRRIERRQGQHVKRFLRQRQLLDSGTLRQSCGAGRRLPRHQVEEHFFPAAGDGIPIEPLAVLAARLSKFSAVLRMREQFLQPDKQFVIRAHEIARFAVNYGFRLIIFPRNHRQAARRRFQQNLRRPFPLSRETEKCRPADIAASTAPLPANRQALRS